MDNGSNRMLGLDNLLESDQTSYEFYHALPQEFQQRIARKDIGSFGEMTQYVAELRRNMK